MKNSRCRYSTPLQPALPSTGLARFSPSLRRANQSCKRQRHWPQPESGQPGRETTPDSGTDERLRQLFAQIKKCRSALGAWHWDLATLGIPGHLHSKGTGDKVGHAVVSGICQILICSQGVLRVLGEKDKVTDPEEHRHSSHSSLVGHSQPHGSPKNHKVIGQGGQEILLPPL